jgi:hypothetical protein
MYSACNFIKRTVIEITGGGNGGGGFTLARVFRTAKVTTSFD